MTVWVLFFFIWIVDQSIRVCAGLILYNVYFCANELLLLTSNLPSFVLEPLTPERKVKGFFLWVLEPDCVRSRSEGLKKEVLSGGKFFNVLEKFLKLEKKNVFFFLIKEKF